MKSCKFLMICIEFHLHANHQKLTTFHPFGNSFIISFKNSSFTYVPACSSRIDLYYCVLRQQTWHRHCLADILNFYLQSLVWQDLNLLSRYHYYYLKVVMHPDQVCDCLHAFLKKYNTLVTSKINMFL